MLRWLVFLGLVLYVLCWLATVPGIHRRQTDGVIDTPMPEQAVPLRGPGLTYGTLASTAYEIAPFYYYGQVSRRFGDKDGYPEMHHYIGIGPMLVTLNADLHEAER